MLKRIAPDAVPSLRRDPVDRKTLSQAAAIIDEVKAGGEPALRARAEAFGDVRPGEPLVIPAAELRAVCEALPTDQLLLLERTAARIRAFAERQRDALAAVVTNIAGGRAGHTALAVDVAGCYAPGGRFPLPSSVLMTAVTARVAGVSHVWVASPRPTPITLAASAVAGADAVLAVGGAQAIAAMAYGIGPVPACDVIVGPGNRWVTAAKQLVSGRVAIDMLAGPSELVVLADDSVDPGVVAADLLAQAEHDPDAVPVLVTTSASIADAVDAELEQQLRTLPTAPTASAAIDHGFTVVVSSIGEGVRVCNNLAAEHLQLHVAHAAEVVPSLRHYGALFIGANAAEVLGDYGAGPNHVLPTGGTARYTGGLSVMTFLRVRTWMRIDRPEEAIELMRDAVELARLEGLEAHARAAERRLRAASPRR